LGCWQDDVARDTACQTESGDETPPGQGEARFNKGVVEYRYFGARDGADHVTGGNACETEEATMTLDGSAAVQSFREGYVEADGFRIRYLEAGRGEPLVVLHGGGGLRHYTSHDILSTSRRVILLEAPGFGASPANESSRTMADLANTLARAIENLGVTKFDLCGTSFGGKLALLLAVQHPDSLRALVLVGPAAIRPESTPQRPPGQARLYAHPERQPGQPTAAPEVVEKQRALTRRLMGPPRDQDLEEQMAGLNIPVLVVFGTLDGTVPPEMGRHYKEILPNCNLVFLYDAAHEADADRPEAFASLVNDFLQRHGAFVVKAESDLINR
jgi:pimeloyl-ACP methyl ester carboxylesterase